MPQSPTLSPPKKLDEESLHRQGLEAMQRHLDSDASGTPIIMPEPVISALREYTNQMVSVQRISEGASKRAAILHLGRAKQMIIGVLQQHNIQDPGNIADQALNAYTAPLETALGRAA